MTSRAEILRAACEAAMVDWAATHGGAEDTFGRIAGKWPAYLAIYVRAADVEALMVARARGNPRHEDNWVDMAGYAACGGELATGGAA